MAGHRHQTGRPRRTQTASHRMAEHLAAAPTPEARLAVAFDWFRQAVARDGKRRDGGDGMALTREMTDRLVRAAAQLEGSAR